MHLNNRARDLLDKYSSGMAQQFGARDTSRYFSLNDPQENALRLALLESVEFLNMITCLDVDQLSGQVISVGSSVLHTGRSENGRFVRQVGVDGNDYSLVETDSCAALRWDLLSVWANAGKDENEFYNLVQAFTTQAFALDMLRIGFNGKSRAKTTNPTDNPNGEDVNIGWHERMKTLLGGNQIMTDPVVLDEAGDYKSLDAMASTRRRFILRCRCRYLWPGMTLACSSSHQKGRWLKLRLPEAARINRLSGRHCRMVPACRMLSPVSSCNSSGLKCRSVLPRLATG